MVYYLYSKLRGELLRSQTAFSQQDTFIVLPVCTMESYVHSREDWAHYFGLDGVLREKIVSALRQAGASPENVYFYNYLLREKICIHEYSHVIIPGGDALLGLQRMREAGLNQQLMRYCGNVIGYSAGALMLQEQFFLSPNYYYTSFTMYRGLGLLPPSFALEVHFDGTKQMRGYIDYAMQQLRVPVMAIGNGGGVKYDSDHSGAEIAGDVTVFFSLADRMVSDGSERDLRPKSYQYPRYCTLY